MKRIHPLSFGLGIASGVVILAVAGGVSHMFSHPGAARARGFNGVQQLNPGSMQRMMQGGGGLGGGRTFQRGG